MFFPTKWQITFHRSLQHADCGLWRNTQGFGWVRALRFFSWVAWAGMYSSSNSTCGSMTCLLFRKEKLISLSLGLYIVYTTYSLFFQLTYPSGFETVAFMQIEAKCQAFRYEDRVGQVVDCPESGRSVCGPLCQQLVHSSTYFNIIISSVLSVLIIFHIVQPVFPPSLITLW